MGPVAFSIMCQISFHGFMCVHACVRACVRVCVRESVRACVGVRACVRASVCVRPCASVGPCACVCMIVCLTFRFAANGQVAICIVDAIVPADAMPLAGSLMRRAINGA